MFCVFAAENELFFSKTKPETRQALEATPGETSSLSRNAPECPRSDPAAIDEGWPGKATLREKGSLASEQPRLEKHTEVQPSTAHDEATGCFYA